MEVDGSGSVFRKGGALGRYQAKALKPDRRCELADYFRYE